MKIIVVGGNGTIGKAVVNELVPRHEIITAGREHGDVKVNMNDKKSIAEMYKAAGKLDAVIVTAGNVRFGALTEMKEEHYQIGLQNKLMGQINLVLIGLNYLNDAGSFTLTSGVLTYDPIRLGSSASMVNGAIEGFVRSAALEMPRGMRINVISPTVLTESMAHYAEYFRGFVSVPAAKVALAYSKSVEGAQTGQVYKAE